jgi:hypothetical protein
MAETATRTAEEQIVAAATAWPGVEAIEGERGELSLRVGRRELGHLHGSRTAHFAFPKALWQELFDAGRIGYHPIAPGKPGLAARQIEGPEDVADVIALLRLNLDRLAGTPG